MEYQCLPEDMIGEIYSFLPLTTMYILNKTLFNKHYPTIINKYTIASSTCQSYIRRIIRRDCNFQLTYLLKSKNTKWMKKGDWKFKNTTFPSYILFLKLLTVEYESQHCRSCINRYLETTLSKKNRHKKIRSKNSKWSN